MSTIKADNFVWKTGESGGNTAFTATGAQIVYGVCKSWGQFSGATVAGSFNLSSVTVNATGDFTMAFSTAMGVTTYSLTGVAGSTTAAAIGQGLVGVMGYVYSSGSIRLTTQSYTGTGFTYNQSSFAVFR